MSPDKEVSKREKELTKRAGQLNTVLVHLYRGEVQRANTWRMRMDETPNYAIVLTAAIITWTFSSPSRTHLLLLLSTLLIAAFLYIEARRYRTYEVWRSRVQVIEENFIAQMLHPTKGEVSKKWKEMLAEDLRSPKHKISHLQAISNRLHRVYIWLFLVIFVAWIMKLWHHPTGTGSFEIMMKRAQIGAIPGTVVMPLVGGIMVFMILFSLWGWKKEREYMGAISEEEPEYDWEAENAGGD